MIESRAQGTAVGMHDKYGSIGGSTRTVNTLIFPIGSEPGSAPVSEGDGKFGLYLPAGYSTFICT